MSNHDVTSGYASEPKLVNAAGWMLIYMQSYAHQPTIKATQTAAPFADATFHHYGLPVIGFALKQRTFGGVTRNFASLSEHGYERARTAVAD